MSPAGKKIQDATAKSVKEMKTQRRAEERFTRFSKEEKDDFYWWATHFICELNNCSKTSEAKLKYARDTMSAMFEQIRAEKDVVFPESKAKWSLEMLGNYDELTLRKPRKRSRY